MLSLAWKTSSISKKDLKRVVECIVGPLINANALGYIDLISDEPRLPEGALTSLRRLEEFANTIIPKKHSGSDHRRMGVSVELAHDAELSASFFNFLPYSIHVEVYPQGPSNSRGLQKPIKVVVHDTGSSLAVDITEDLWASSKETVTKATGLLLDDAVGEIGAS